MSPTPSSVDSRARIWLVGDSPLEAAIARRALERHDVEIFHDPNIVFERLSAAATERPDLVVLDWHMPGTSGLEACRFLRRRADRIELPILFLTASDRREDLEEGLAAGANDFVRKPFEAAELRARVASLVDIRRLREALTRSEMSLREEASFREQFLAILAHDLRQPLNVFALGSHGVASAGSTPEFRAVLASKMTRASGRMQRMIGELLDFSRSRPVDGMPITRRTTNLAEVAHQVIDEIRIAQPDRRIDVAAAGICEGSWDPDRLAQVVSNLVENALANSPSDSAVGITLSSDGGNIALAVENAGPTIAPEILPTIFDAFRRQSKTNRTGGLGLGLYIVAQIVRAHGGSIKAESSAGRTRFEVSLPILFAA